MPLDEIDLYLAGMYDHHKALSVARTAVIAKIVAPEDEVTIYMREIQHLIEQRIARGELPYKKPNGRAGVDDWRHATGSPN